MAAYFFASYDITDPDRYAGYVPGGVGVITQTLQKHGGKVLSVGDESEWVAGERKMVVLFEFPDMDAARAWLQDPEYAEVKKIRLASTDNRVELVAPAYAPPSA